LVLSLSLIRYYLLCKPIDYICIYHCNSLFLAKLLQGLSRGFEKLFRFQEIVALSRLFLPKLSERLSGRAPASKGLSGQAAGAKSPVQPSTASSSRPRTTSAASASFPARPPSLSTETSVVASQSQFGRVIGSFKSLC
jgi:hypothetical protein